MEKRAQELETLDAKKAQIHFVEKPPRKPHFPHFESTTSPALPLTKLALVHVDARWKSVSMLE